MGKMSDRKRKGNRAKRKKAKALKSLELPKFRIPTPPAGKIFKSSKDYDRKDNQKIVQKEILNHEE